MPLYILNTVPANNSAFLGSTTDLCCVHAFLAILRFGVSPLLYIQPRCVMDCGSHFVRILDYRKPANNGDGWCMIPYLAMVSSGSDSSQCNTQLLGLHFG